jgi:hypothetical protein
MIIKKNLRPTSIRTNSRYRGQTELSKYTNYVLETVHDLKLLGSVLDRNEYLPGHRGHTDFIQDNVVAYVSGNAEITSTVDDATTLLHPLENVFDNLDVMSNTWSTYGGCTRKQTATGVELTTTGLLDPSGIATQKYVEEGDIIYIRMGVRLLSGPGTDFTLGSHDINQGEGDLKKYKIPQNGSIIYVDKRLYCKHREPISINFDVHYAPDTLNATSVEISDVEIRYISENSLTTAPTNGVIKPRINSLEDKIQNMITNI